MNTRQLEEKSDAERHDIENTIGELRQRLSPGQLLDEVLAYTKDGGGAFLSNFGRQASANPLPVSLIGAGLAWFLFSKGGENAGQRSQPAQSDAKAAVTEWGEKVAEASSSGLEQAPGLASQAGERIREGVDRAADAASGTSERIATSLSQGAAAVSDAAKSAASSGKAMATSSLAFLKDQPLILLGAGVALGAAIGTSIPKTDVEDKLMGEAAGEIKSQASDMAGEQLEKAKDSGEHLYGEIAQSIKQEIEGLTGGKSRGQDGGGPSIQ